MWSDNIEHEQTAIRGGKPLTDGINLANFIFTSTDQDILTTLTCPQAQTAPVKAGKQADRFIVHFDATSAPLALCANSVQPPAPVATSSPSSTLRSAACAWRRNGNGSNSSTPASMCAPPSKLLSAVLSIPCRMTKRPCVAFSACFLCACLRLHGQSAPHPQLLPPEATGQAAVAAVSAAPMPPST